MSILVNKTSRVLTQGITGATGQFHTRACKEYGTKMVGGVVPGKGGTAFEGIPIFDTCDQARDATGANATVIYVPPAFAADAIMEAAAAGIDEIITIGEIGGTAEEEAAAYTRANVKKPVVAFIAGQTAPKGRRMGHAGAIISGGRGTAADKIAALKAAGIAVAMSPADLGSTMKNVLDGKAA